jgi:hypothetical protein
MKIAWSNNRKLFFILLFLLGVGTFVFLLKFSPSSSVEWVLVPDVWSAKEELCDGQRQLYPRSLHTWTLPAFSPDRKYYVNIAKSRFGLVKAVVLLRADGGQEVGRYFSDYSEFFIHCWAKDSSGVYISDYKPGTGSLFVPFSTGGKIGPVKKLLVPQ